MKRSKKKTRTQELLEDEAAKKAQAKKKLSLAELWAELDQDAKDKNTH